MQPTADMKAEQLVEYPASLADEGGVPYVSRALGRRRADGLWEGWLEFERVGGDVRVRTERETTQPNHTDLVYWASGLTAVYLEGAFRRAVEAAPAEREGLVAPTSGP